MMQGVGEEVKLLAQLYRSRDREKGVPVGKYSLQI